MNAVELIQRLAAITTAPVIFTKLVFGNFETVFWLRQFVKILDLDKGGSSSDIAKHCFKSGREALRLGLACTIVYGIWNAEQLWIELSPPLRTAAKQVKLESKNDLALAVGISALTTFMHSNQTCPIFTGMLFGAQIPCWWFGIQQFRCIENPDKCP